MLDQDMTPAQKAARTRAMNKIWAEYEMRIQPSNDAFYAFAETLYPERDRIIDEAEAERDRVIAEAEAKCQAIRDLAMAKFEKIMEPLEAERTAIRKVAYEIVKTETAKFVEQAGI
jgi:hypothetical protein